MQALHSLFTRLFKVGVCAGLLMAMAACGGGQSAGSTGAQSGAPPAVPMPLATQGSNLFPLDANGVSVYASTASTDAVVVRVAGTRVLADQQTATQFRLQDPRAPVDRVRAYVTSDAGLRQYAAEGADAVERAFDGSYVMRWPAYAGDNHVQVDTSVDASTDVDGDGRVDRVALRADVTVVGLEAVTTPGGVFDSALRVQQVLRQTLSPSSGGPTQQVVTTTDTWYAPGVGVVRQVQSELGPGAGGPVTLTLVKYRFGARSNDTDVPTPQSMQPAGGSRALATARVVMQFSEEMDETSITPQSFVVTDAAGRPITGTLRVSGRAVSFTPAQPLLTGVYRVNVSTAVQDLFGRRLATEATEFFTVDATAPQMLSTWPTAEALNVLLNTTISVQLSESPASESVNASTVQLLLNGAVVQATVRAIFEGISIEPQGGLQRGKRYEVAVNGVTDVAGNPMAQGLRFGFDTTPGRFDSPERVQPPGNGSIGALSLTAGDVNGDGIPDIVYSDGGDEGYPDAVYLRTGRADGQLESQVRVNLSTYFQATSTRRCPITGLAIGDLTGDGRPDVAVASWNCGVLVLRQTASGALEPGQFSDELVQNLRIADLNGDGRADLVGVQNYWNKAFVWLQQPDGRLLLTQTPGLGDVAARDIAVGDIDGDGRPDLVIALRSQHAITANVAILIQQPDGRFALGPLLSTGTTRGIFGVAVGDFNGDGRLDIVGTTAANSPASLLVFLQAADGSFPSPTALPTMDGAYGVVVADINGDGRSDIVVWHEGWFLVGIYLQKDNGTLAPEELYEAAGRSVNVQVLAIADINRDGLLDIIGPASLLRQVPLTGGTGAGATTGAWRPASARSGTP